MSEVAESNKNALAEVAPSENVPAFLNKYSGKGQEDVKLEAIKLPYLGLAQGSSAIVKAGNAKYGEFYNSITQETFGNEVTVIVVKMEEDWIRFPSKEEKETAKKENKFAAIKRSKDGVHWDDGSRLSTEEVKYNKQYVFYVVIRDHLQPIPFIVSMKKTSRNAGRDFYQILSQNIKSSFAGEPIFARAYTLNAKEKEKEGDTYLVFNTPQPAGWATEEEASICNDMRDNIDKFVKIREEQAAMHDDSSETDALYSTADNSAGMNVAIEDDDLE